MKANIIQEIAVAVLDLILLPMQRFSTSRLWVKFGLSAADASVA